MTFHFSLNCLWRYINVEAPQFILLKRKQFQYYDYYYYSFLFVNKYIFYDFILCALCAFRGDAYLNSCDTENKKNGMLLNCFMIVVHLGPSTYNDNAWINNKQLKPIHIQHQKQQWYYYCVVTQHKKHIMLYTFINGQIYWLRLCVTCDDHLLNDYMIAHTIRYYTGWVYYIKYID